MSDVPLKEHLESRLIALEKATALAANTLEKRLEGMNEFREALRYQTSLFVTRTELQVLLEKIEVDLRILRQYKVALESKASQAYVTVTMVIAILGAIISVIMLMRNI